MHFDLKVSLKVVSCTVLLYTEQWSKRKVASVCVPCSDDVMASSAVGDGGQGTVIVPSTAASMFVDKISLMV